MDEIDVAMKADLDQWLAQARHDRSQGMPTNPDDIVERWIAAFDWDPDHPMIPDDVGSLFCLFAHALHKLLEDDEVIPTSTGCTGCASRS
jgi:hypothetical protein